MLLEHVSLTVADLDAETAFLQTALPDFRVRGGGQTQEKQWEQRWPHAPFKRCVARRSSNGD